MRDKLTVQIVDGELRISVPVATLANAARFSPVFMECWNPVSDKSHLQIPDDSLFASAVVHRLDNEEEDGSTLVTRMFDAAFMELVDQGDDGIVDDEMEAEFDAEPDDDFNFTAALEP